MDAVLAIVTEECWFSAEGTIGLQRQAAVAAADLSCFGWILTLWASRGSDRVDFAAEWTNVVVG
jgi:hypothetical protein